MEILIRYGRVSKTHMTQSCQDKYWAPTRSFGLACRRQITVMDDSSSVCRMTAILCCTLYQCHTKSTTGLIGLLDFCKPIPILS
ncbi:hypothetical protein HYC85_009021 [Camellia sinensis]|uniref:Uncharacterized protein n=1 Tax=Camellia sinensis TaxID=4442 RepID=A0A7J7HUJ1_CAMSI|nr:hypothetical protein HYC85_009021 [Camellia sinensis]